MSNRESPKPMVLKVTGLIPVRQVDSGLHMESEAELPKWIERDMAWLGRPDDESGMDDSLVTLLGQHGKILHYDPWPENAAPVGYPRSVLIRMRFARMKLAAGLMAKDVWLVLRAIATGR